MKRIAMDKLDRGRGAYTLLVLCAATTIALPAQTFTTLYNFCSKSDCTDGAAPFAGLVQATDGNFYGTTDQGGIPTQSGAGTVFKIAPSGALTILYSFCAQSGCTDGEYPYAGLVQAANGDFYGTTVSGGANSNNAFCSEACGTVFKITPRGNLTTLYNFCSKSDCTDGAAPYAGLVQATNGDFYGTTQMGGTTSTSCPGGSCGTVFKITPNGKLTTLHSFDGTDGANPYAGLVQGTNGDLYGTTEYGTAKTRGTVFKITPAGHLTTLHTFCSRTSCADGGYPMGTLVQASSGNFYGTTYSFGANGETGGTVFQITPSGTLTTLYSFCAKSDCTDGAGPYAGVVQGTDGNLYGTTMGGGLTSCETPTGCGTVFQITPSGTLTTLYMFCSQIGCADGFIPYAGLIQATNGNFYGTTAEGGVSIYGGGYGTAFSLSVGLGPFVETQTTSGVVGAPVTILGTNLTGATGVTFNGTAATFTVNATGTAISTTVPVGATTGTVQVTLSGGSALSSYVPFRVT